MSNYQLINNNQLKEHELVNIDHLVEVYKGIKLSGFVRDPLIVDQHTFIILDGHHRFHALKLLGLSSSPVYLC